MSLHFACIAAHPIAIRAGIEAARSDVAPAELSHNVRQAYRLAWPATHRHFQVIKDISRGDALNSIVSGPALEFAQGRFPWVFGLVIACRLRAIPEFLQKG